MPHAARVGIVDPRLAPSRNISSTRREPRSTALVGIAGPRSSPARAVVLRLNVDICDWVLRTHALHAPYLLVYFREGAAAHVGIVDPLTIYCASGERR